ncbi:bifunctional diguanylate cyclase/phosphodiesterase [Neptunomonas phycophila]|uniref:bifunctional diguanylate cyclase/phosphodiesterase n=1 Tax=Neptunomonas phycophila TaxID=1572645 RepID=UPI000948FE83|nr:EAL domain-containing protein [Neptunomonas phycophila]
MHRLFGIICTSHLPTAFTAISLVVLYGLVLWLPPLAAQASKTPEFVETSETLKQSGDIDLHRTQDIQSMSPDSLDDTDTSPEAANAIFNSGFRLSLEEGLQTDTVIKYMMIASSLLLLTGYWVWVLRREIRIRQSAEMREQGRSQVLESLSKATPLPDILMQIVRNVEHANPEMLCSILILNPETKQLTYGAAPSLPDFYNTAVEGLMIGDGIGSCGTAAFRGERVIAENLQTHPYWQEFKALTKKANLASCWSQPIIDSDGVVLGTFAIYHRTPMLPSKQEIQLIESYASLADIVITTHRIEKEIRIAATAFESNEGMLVTNADHIIIKVNQAFTRITGYSAEEAIGQSPDILNSQLNDTAQRSTLWQNINETGFWEGELWGRHKHGHEHPEHLSIRAVKDTNGKITNYVATITDITLRKEAAEEIERLAFYDPLTQLPNRRLLLERLHQAVITSQRNGTTGALLFLDLDQFKTLNDTLGHSVGDTLLNEVAKRLSACVRDNDTVARLGGDEFVVILENLNSNELHAGTQTEIITHKILDKLSTPYKLEQEDYTLSTSAGAALFHGDVSEVEELLKQADIAMYQAKKSGRNQLRFFDNDMQDAINIRVERERELEVAIAQKEFQLYYQVQVNDALKPIGAEALIRWIHPQRGLIPPVEFIPLAEENGLILPIGQWVLESACEQLDQWQDNPATQHLSISINVSAKQFHLDDFIEQVKSTIGRYRFPIERLKFELTEGLLLDDIEKAATRISQLGSLGIQVSLDDFGTGYSSLQYLKKLPLYQLKIDQSFVRDIPGGDRDIAIVRTIIAMTESLGLNVIAEGVENQQQLDCLIHEKCSHFQGYFFQKPIPVDKFTAFIQSTMK